MCCCSTGLEELQRCADHKAKRCGGEAATGVLPSFLHCSLLRRTQPCGLHHDTQLLAGQCNKELIALALQNVWLVSLRSHPSLALLHACASLTCHDKVINAADADDAVSILAIRDCACCCVSCDSAALTVQDWLQCHESISCTSCFAPVDFCNEAYTLILKSDLSVSHICP